MAFGVVGLFMLITGLAMVTGNWQNNVAPDEYLEYQKTVQSLGHPTDTDDIKGLNRQSGR